VFTVRDVVTNVVVPQQTGVWFDSLLLLEDEAGYWLFDSDDIITWDFGVAGKALTVPKSKKRGTVYG
jgi:hypothetical protein